MDLKTLNNIKKQLDKLEYTEYTLNIQFKDNTSFNLNKSVPEQKKSIGFSK